MTTGSGFWDNASIISTYTREQALQDGTLVAADLEMARDAGFRIPVAYTRAVYLDCVEWGTLDDEQHPGAVQDQNGRAWDVLWMAAQACRRGRDGENAKVRLLVVSRQTGRAGNVDLFVNVGPDDTGSPVVTIMTAQDL